MQGVHNSWGAAKAKAGTRADATTAHGPYVNMPAGLENVCIWI